MVAELIFLASADLHLFVCTQEGTEISSLAFCVGENVAWLFWLSNLCDPLNLFFVFYCTYFSLIS